jgi:bisphosphoglycerate-dependent phosphoglycerate mutase
VARHVAYRLVVVRHGESEFNAQDRFTGWVGCPLTAKGIQKRIVPGAIVRDAGWRFDRLYTSVLQRYTESARIIRDELPEPRPLRCPARRSRRRETRPAAVPYGPSAAA